MSRGGAGRRRSGGSGSGPGSARKRAKPQADRGTGRGPAPGKGQPRSPRAGGRGPARGPGRDGQRGTTPIRDADAGRGRNGSLGGDQVEGRHAVRELLLAQTRRTREVILAGDLDPAPILDEIVDLADEAKVPIREISRATFESMTRSEASQGVMAMAAPLRPTDLDDLLRPVDGTAPFLLLLDSITDPGNLGAILRTAEGAGVTGVVLPRHRAAHVTPTVAKAAAGAVEHLRMALVGGLPAAMASLQAAGIWTVGLDAGGERSIDDLSFAAEPVALVLGPRARGCRGSCERCDVVVDPAARCARLAQRRRPPPSPASRWPPPLGGLSSVPSGGAAPSSR
ncbi:MAG: RNA methyltransferase [Acidimicrobiales bacterium]